MAQLAKRDPSDFDVEAYLRETLSPAEFERLSREARDQFEKMAAEQGVHVDESGFRRLMQEQRDRAKADAKSDSKAEDK